MKADEYNSVRAALKVGKVLVDTLWTVVLESLRRRGATMNAVETLSLLEA